MVNKRFIYIALLLIVALGGYYAFGDKLKPSSAPAAENHEEAGHEDGDHKEAGHGEEGHAEGGHDEEEKGIALSAETAEKSGIAIEPVASAPIRETIHLTGRIVLNQNATAQVKARFPGVVRSVNKSAGETVAKGDTLATVESNDSLQVYAVKSPLSGTVLSRSTNIGDVAGDEPMFVVADLSKMWAEFHIFPRDLSRIKTGQKIHVESVDGGLKTETAISAILPVAEAASQTVIARAAIDNAEGHWRSGIVVHGAAVIDEREASLAVKNTALQRIGEDTVVFVQDGETFSPRKIKLGMRDNHFTEVLEGLQHNERYASTNSFLLKAELGKSEAEHAH